MTLEKLHDFGVLCKVGKNPYPTHAFDLLTDNTNKAAKIQCALFKGKTRDIFIDKKEFNGPIYEQVDDAYHFVLRHIDIGAEIEGEYRKDVYELPISAIREMIANAVLHRSYLDKSCVQVCLYSDRLEVSSPGMLYGGLDLKTAKLGKSTCRNEVIAEAFHYMHIVEAWGTGLPRIINRCKEYGLPAPLFEEFGNGFKVTIFRKASNDQGKVSNVFEKVSNGSKKVSNGSEKISNAFEEYLPMFEEAEVSQTFIKNIEQVYGKCGVGIPFGQMNVMEWLSCSKSKATNIMNAMKAAKVIKKVTGMGPGKYKFVE
jgi:predicted HTH transcriptional regulator